ncbi:MAG TPA: PPC domain-containing DNA-binding protein [Actinomycetota bacterium]|nr:PPC domain-containing DNA-binding protein [Actinomycetota bacterium]
MKARRVNEHTFVVVLEPGEEVVAGLTGFAAEQGVTAARVSGIGALSEVTFGFYERDRKDYDRMTLAEQVELLSLLGNLTVTDEGPRLHAHVVVSRTDGTALGGHLFHASVWPTLEAFVVSSPVELRRRMNDEVGLPLIEP